MGILASGSQQNLVFKTHVYFGKVCDGAGWEVDSDGLWVFLSCDQYYLSGSCFVALDFLKCVFKDVLGIHINT